MVQYSMSICDTVEWLEIGKNICYYGNNWSRVLLFYGEFILFASPAYSK
jgi:hypothetical protein